MRRSICSCSPAYAKAGDLSTWTFSYTTATDLPKGTHIKFDPNSWGRDMEWQLPQTDLKNKTNLIWAKTPSGKTIAAQSIAINGPIYYEFVLPSDIAIGESFTIYMGSPGKDVQKNGTKAQEYTERKRPFYLSIDPTGKGNYKEAEAFHMDIRGNKLHNLSIITPSFVDRNKRFDVIVRFEDAFGNLTNDAPEETLIELSYQNLRENLNWKLFVPETGFLTLPNLYFNEPGTYRIQLLNLHTKQMYYSAPIKCFPDSNLHLFWGLLHGESEKVDTSEHIEAALRHFRDERAMQFYATSSFDSAEETNTDTWKIINQNITEVNEEDRFISFLGLQWLGTPIEEGLRQFLFLKEQKALPRKKELKYNALKKIYKTYQSKDLISIPSFTMNEDTAFDFKDYNPQFERVVEIYNAWGSSEMLAQEGNPRPISDEKKKNMIAFADGSIQQALKNNCRFGFVAGGLDDRGCYSNFYDSDQKQYSPGLTAVIAKNHSRESIFEALYHRSCYATTGERMIVGLFLAEKPMGSELDTKTKPGLAYNRYLTGYVVGTDIIEQIDIIRNGKVIHSFHPKKDELDFDYDDKDPISSVTLKTKEDKPSFIYYYLRVRQKNGSIAWSSPIWVDHIQTTKVAPKQVIKSKKEQK